MVSGQEPRAGNEDHRDRSYGEQFVVFATATDVGGFVLLAKLLPQERAQQRVHSHRKLMQSVFLFLELFVQFWRWANLF